MLPNCSLRCLGVTSAALNEVFAEGRGSGDVIPGSAASSRAGSCQEQCFGRLLQAAGEGVTVLWLSGAVWW